MVHGQPPAAVSQTFKGKAGGIEMTYMTLRNVRTGAIWLLLVSMVFVGMQSTGHAASSPREEFTVISAKINDVAIWLPSTIVVHSGERVTLRLINTVDAVHGFSVDDYEIHGIPYNSGGRIVPAGGVKEVTFIAKKGLVSRYYCQLHPERHIGGQIVVLP
jgi:plastocyanin